MSRVLFCNIAYMQYYDFSMIKEVPKYVYGKLEIQ